MSALEIQELAVRFGGVAALGGVSFSVAEGTVTSLIGPNGAGKTTAFNVITGFQRPTGGQVRHAGTAVTAASARVAGWIPTTLGVLGGLLIGGLILDLVRRRR